MAYELISAFKEIKEKTLEEISQKQKSNKQKTKWNINPIDTVPKKGVPPYWSYVWRDVREQEWKLSVHSFWAAIDINQTVNKRWMNEKQIENAKNSPYYITEDFAKIMKEHGFYRWQDWTNSKIVLNSSWITSKKIQCIFHIQKNQIQLKNKYFIF